MKTKHKTSLALSIGFSLFGASIITPLAFADEFTVVEEEVSCTSGVAQTYRIEQDYDSSSHLNIVVKPECDALTIDLNGKVVDDGKIGVPVGANVLILDSVGGGAFKTLSRTGDCTHILIGGVGCSLTSLNSKNIIIESGTFSGGYVHVRKLTINGGNFSNTTFWNPENDSENLIINGGNFRNVGIDRISTGKITITGGTFDDFKISNHYYKNDVNVFIEGGSFNDLQFINTESGYFTMASISGGNFNAKPDHIADGYEVTEESGRYVVVPERLRVQMNTILPMNIDNTAALYIYGNSQYTDGFTASSSDESVLKLERSSEFDNVWTASLGKPGVVEITYTAGSEAHNNHFRVFVIPEVIVDGYSNSQEREDTVMFLSSILSCAQENNEETVQCLPLMDLVMAFDDTDAVLDAARELHQLRITAPTLDETEIVLDEAQLKAEELGLTILSGYYLNPEISIYDLTENRELSKGVNYQLLNQRVEIPESASKDNINIIQIYKYEDDFSVHLNKIEVDLSDDSFQFDFFGHPLGESYYYLASVPLSSIGAPDTGEMTKNSSDFAILLTGIGVAGVAVAGFGVNYTRRRIEANRRIKF